VAGDTLYIDAPEPNAMFLLLGGIASLLGLGLRRRQLGLA
jgi:PEP-CTERM motif